MKDFTPMASGSAEGAHSPAVAKPGAVGQSWSDWVQACWNEVGAHGTKECVRLKEFAHCRHCPVYSAAGARLLDRPLPERYREEWAEYFGGQEGLREPGNVSALLFRLGPEWLALPTQVVSEVVERRPIHSLPGREKRLVLGIANIRGELVMCISLGHLLGLEATASPETLRLTHARLLVSSWDSRRFVFPVNEVSGPHQFNSQEMLRPPATVCKFEAAYSQSVVRWREQSVGLLDPGLLFRKLGQARV
jgi:chemotaxis-related protein WspD